MKRGREDSEEPPAKRPASQVQDMQLALAKQRAQWMEERAEWMEERAELQQKAAEMEKRSLVAEHRLALLESKAPEVAPISKPHEFHWLNTNGFTMSDDVLGLLTTFLTDDDLFRLRGVSQLWYRAYYSQSGRVHHWAQDAINSLRAVRLAGMGRVFCKLERLGFYDEISGNDISKISPFNFPRVTALNLPVASSGALWSLPPNPNLTRLKIRRQDANFSWQWFTTERFPALRFLRLGIPVGVQGSVHPHGNVDSIELKFLGPLLQDAASARQIAAEFQWNTISRENFPKLKVIHVWCDGWPDLEVFPQLEKARLTAEGFVCR